MATQESRKTTFANFVVTILLIHKFDRLPLGTRTVYISQVFGWLSDDMRGRVLDRLKQVQVDGDDAARHVASQILTLWKSRHVVMAR